MQARIKKVTTTYYQLDNSFSHNEVKYYPQIKTKLLPFWRNIGYIGWDRLESAKEYLFEHYGKKYQEIEYFYI